MIQISTEAFIALMIPLATGLVGIGTLIWQVAGFKKWITMKFKGYDKILTKHGQDINKLKAGTYTRGNDELLPGR